MVMEDIITALENYVRLVNKEAVFVLQKEVEPCKYKAYERHRYTLWYIDKLRNKKFNIYTLQEILRVVSPEEEQNAVKQFEIKFMTELFKFVRGREFNLILGGSYEENESVSDSDN